jgi:hypothetical protein
MTMTTAKVTDGTNRARSPLHRFQGGLLSMIFHRAPEFLIITTAPSTIIPKPIAPRLIRFPLTPNSRIPKKLITIGTIEAVMMAARYIAEE